MDKQEVTGASGEEVFGIECEHHYGITTHPLPTDGNVGREVYRLIREAWHAPREGGGLHDDDHDWEISEADAPDHWSRVVIRKNARSPLFVLRPSWYDDGPGALWFSQSFRIATRGSIEREIADKLGWADRWEKEANGQRDSARGRKRRDKLLSFAKHSRREAQGIQSRWPEFDGTSRTEWQQRLHKHRDNARDAIASTAPAHD